MLLYRKISFIWKMLVLLFVFVPTYATNISSYVHVCGRKDPNYDQCIMDNIYGLKNKLCAGIPEFNISPVEPIIIDKIVIYDTDNLKLSLKDVKAMRICDEINLNSVHTDPERLHFNFEILLNLIYIEALYNFNMHVLVSLANEGQVTITTPNVLMKVNMDLKVATKNGEKQIYASKVNTNLNITVVKYKFDESRKELEQLHQVMSNIIDNNIKHIITIIKSAEEEKISQIVISIFNKLSYSNYEKLFPETV